jgi:hypothetical protein
MENQHYGGVEDLMVKFDRGDVIGELEGEWGVTYSVVLEVTFEMLDETEM